MWEAFERKCDIETVKGKRVEIKKATQEKKEDRQNVPDVRQAKFVGIVPKFIEFHSISCEKKY